MDRRLLRAFSLAMACSLAPSAYALNTEEAEPHLLMEYAVTLSAHAAKHQWQRLWHATRLAHYFNPAHTTHFTPPSSKAGEKIVHTLANATSVTAYKTSLATYRYEFGDKIGIERGIAVTAICVDVDWRSLPEGTDAEDASGMGSVSLLLARPCP